MFLNALALLDLKPQDRVVTMTQAAYGLPSEELTLYVECVDVLTGVVNTLSGSGNRQAVPFANILDVEKCVTPVTLEVAASTWNAHQCDPAYLGKPVRAIAVMLGERGQFSGLCIPKWPGSRPGQVLHINVAPSSVGVAEENILSGLPSNQAQRFHDPERVRNRIKRIACNHIKGFIESTVGAGMKVCLPVDPSLKVQGGLLTSGKVDMRAPAGSSDVANLESWTVSRALFKAHPEMIISIMPSDDDPVEYLIANCSAIPVLRTEFGRKP